MTHPTDDHSIVRENWLTEDQADRIISAFEKRFGILHIALACHASLPLILTTELVNLIRINFLEQFNIPWIAEADILLSPFCRPIGDGIYEFEPRIRELLIKRLKSLGAVFGFDQPVKIAQFLLRWLERRPDIEQRRDVSEPFRWIAMAYTKPHKLMEEMESRIRQASRTEKDLMVHRAEQIRLINLAELVTQPMETSEQKERFQKLIRQVRNWAKQLDGSDGGGGKPTAGQKREVDVRIGKRQIKMEFAYIPPGTFMMGSPEHEPGRFDDETLHEVKLTQGFYMMTTPVTQGLWETVMGNNLSYFKDGGEECPVESVSWEDAQKFIKVLNKNSLSGVFRLPTEAEWEYACRAGTKTPFWTGKCLSTDEANYNGNYPLKGCPKGIYRKKTTPVEMFKPNPWGLYDMHGNVWEWCQDRYGEYPSKPVTDLAGPDNGSYRVLRGGSWYFPARYCRSAYRDYDSPGSRNDYHGFRLVRSPGQQ